MKQISYRGGIVCFLIPETWVEEYNDDGGAVFYENSPESGTLRLNVVTAQKPDSAPDVKSALLAFMDGKRPADSTLQTVGNGNILCRYTKLVSENGDDMIMHCWEIGNAVGSTHARLALFSFTVLASRKSSVDTLRDVAMLEEQLAAAEFHEGLGDLPPRH